MMRTGKTLALTLSGLALAFGARALTADSSNSRYRGIAERNVFDVHPAPPPPPNVPVSTLPPPPAIRLGGITDILGHPQVLFKTQLPAKPPAQAKEESFVMTVGERSGEIEVLAIDVKARKVQMKVYGVVTNLDLEANAEKLVATAPPPAGAPPPVPGQMAPPPARPTLPLGKFPRTLRLPNSAPTQSPGNAGMSGANYGNYGSGGNPQPQANPLSLEEQTILIEAQRLHDPKIAPYLPPTLANPTANTSFQKSDNNPASQP